MAGLPAVQKPQQLTKIDQGKDERIATGPIKIGNDWPGVFIRGDEALGFAGVLKAMKIENNSIVDELISLFEACRHAG